MAENDALKETEKTNDENSQDMMGNVTKDNIEHLDFITSIILMIVCIMVAYTSYGYYVKSKVIFYASPGFMPIVFAGALFVLSLALMAKSLKKASAKDCIRRVLDAIPRGIKNDEFKNVMKAVLIFALYVFVLIRFIPFWVASYIVLLACFIMLKASTLIKSMIIALLSLGCIFLIFQVIFHVPMP